MLKLMKFERTKLIIIMINILLLQNLTAEILQQFTAEIFAAKLKQADLANKKDIANFVNKTDFENKLLTLNVPIPDKVKKLS